MKRSGSKVLWLILVTFLFVLSYPNQSAQALLNSDKAGKHPRMIFILVDMSGSTNVARRTVYKEGFEKIYDNLDQRDRIMVGTITGRSFIDFKPVVDVEIPQKSLWVNRIQFERELTETKEKIRQEVERLLSRKEGTARTEILNSLNIADTVFHDEKRQKILVIFSDMLQDSREYNFTGAKITDTYIDKIIDDRRKHNLIPDFTNVKVYVAGASGADPIKFRSVEKFWARYFEKSGADFSPHRYGHSLLRFEKVS